MKTLYPVNEETYAKIGEAFLICSNYPDVFEGISYKKFCSMFVDVIEEDEDEREARMRLYASEMYDALLNAMSVLMQNGQDIQAREIRELLQKVTGEEVRR